jgi:hypothetical protein
MNHARRPDLTLRRSAHVAEVKEGRRPVRENRALSLTAASTLTHSATSRGHFGT